MVLDDIVGHLDLTFVVRTWVMRSTHNTSKVVGFDSRPKHVLASLLVATSTLGKMLGITDITSVYFLLMLLLIGARRATATMLLVLRISGFGGALKLLLLVLLLELLRLVALHIFLHGVLALSSLLNIRQKLLLLLLLLLSSVEQIRLIGSH